MAREADNTVKYMIAYSLTSKGKQLRPFVLRDFSGGVGIEIACRDEDSFRLLRTYKGS